MDTFIEWLEGTSKLYREVVGVLHSHDESEDQSLEYIREDGRSDITKQKVPVDVHQDTTDEQSLSSYKVAVVEGDVLAEKEAKDQDKLEIAAATPDAQGEATPKKRPQVPKQQGDVLIQKLVPTAKEHRHTKKFEAEVGEKAKRILGTTQAIFCCFLVRFPCPLRIHCLLSHNSECDLKWEYHLPCLCLPAVPVGPTLHSLALEAVLAYNDLLCNVRAVSEVCFPVLRHTLLEKHIFGIKWTLSPKNNWNHVSKELFCKCSLGYAAFDCSAVSQRIVEGMYALITFLMVNKMVSYMCVSYIREFSKDKVLQICQKTGLNFFCEQL